MAKQKLFGLLYTQILSKPSLSSSFTISKSISERLNSQIISDIPPFHFSRFSFHSSECTSSSNPRSSDSNLQIENNVKHFEPSEILKTRSYSTPALTFQGPVKSSQVLLKTEQSDSSSVSESDSGSGSGLGYFQRKKSGNLSDILFQYPDWGVGACVAKRHWQIGNFYLLTKVSLTRKGKNCLAWGIYYTQGKPESGKEQKVGGALKDEWKLINEREHVERWKTLRELSLTKKPGSENASFKKIQT